MSAEPLKETPPISRAVVKVAADPVVLSVPVVFTPGRSMSAEPLKETPPIIRVVVSSAAEPEYAPPLRVAIPSVILPAVTVPVNVPFTLVTSFIVVKLSVVVLALITTLF